MNKKIEIIKMIINSEEDYSNFNTKLEDLLSKYSINLKKKILVCSIELIQNNLIHNKNKSLLFSICEYDKDIKVITSIFVSNEILKTLSSKIEEINSLDINALKLRYLKNIKNGIDKQKEYTSNGLILCKLKSNNNIEFKTFKQDKNQEECKFELSLKFNKYENHKQEQ